MRNLLSSTVLGFLGVSGLGLAAGCTNGSSPMMTMMPPGTPIAVCSSYLPATAKASTGVGAGSSATSATMVNSGACTEVTTDVVRADAADIVAAGPSGYTALGGAIAFTSASTTVFPHGLDYVVPADMTKAPTGAPANRIVVFEKSPSGTVAVAAVSDVVYDAAFGRLHFHSLRPGTFQAAIASTAGQSRMRHYTYRAIGGVSMGGIGSSLNFWRHPDLYDVLSVMGADPGPDLTYTLGILHDWFFAGFCTAADGVDKIGQLCPSTRMPLADQGELEMSYEHLIYQPGQGVGLTLGRSTYMRAFRDLSRAFGNAAYATDPSSTAAFHTYLPPGIPVATLTTANATICDPTQTTVLKNFYDYQYNPDGSLPVITVCDGNDSPTLGLGVFDESIAQTTPAQIILAVDVNGNGKRDSGEPVLLQGSEHFYDWGTDGLPDAMEPGYDPVTNPDPDHDDYHYLHNPLGTEGNWRYDVGEKFDDFGVDGVKGVGCSVDTGDPTHKPYATNADGSITGCYDYGEGNGKFDYAESTSNWYAHDPRTQSEALTPAQLDRVAVYYDAGIRDFLNAEVSTNSLVGSLTAHGSPVRSWNGFPAMVGLSPSNQQQWNLQNVDFTQLGRYAYVRYGDPDASEATVDSDGDGRHVGTDEQAAARALMLFSFVSHQWPGGDYDVPDDLTGGAEQDLMFTAKSGRVTPYSVVVPPGYFDAENATKTYPVLYLMHGYGMDPMGLASVAVIASSQMVNTSVPADKRIQKMIIVLVDGQCRPKQDLENGILDFTGDDCEEGTFYGDHADGKAQAEEQLMELQAIIDANYRVKAPQDILVND